MDLPPGGGLSGRTIQARATLGNRAEGPPAGPLVGRRADRSAWSVIFSIGRPGFRARRPTLRDPGGVLSLLRWPPAGMNYSSCACKASAIPRALPDGLRRSYESVWKHD